jgi:hypothetical protein
MIEKIGRSGVELHQVRKHVNADGEDCGPRQKPNNAYLDGKAKTKGGRGPQGCTRMVSHGFGPSKMNRNEDIPKLSKDEKDVLLAIDASKLVLDQKRFKIADTLVKKGFVVWSDTKNDYTCMAEGRRVAELLREGKK